VALSQTHVKSDLRAFEKRVVGPGHAAEHAGARREVREGTLSSAEPRSSLAPRVVGPADQIGRWGAPFSIPVMAIHAALLPTGKVLWFAYPKNPSPRYGGDGGASPNTSQAWLWDPVSGQSKQVNPPLWRDPADGVLKPANIWCAGQSLLADGRLLVTGGNLQYADGDVDWKGLNKVYTFNPFNETWTEQPDMRRGRWYPSQVLMADGRTMIMSGRDETGVKLANRNPDIELFTPSADMDGRGTVTLLGQRGASGQPPLGGDYPHLFSMPSGRTLVSGPFTNDSWFVNDPGASNTFSWQEAANLPINHIWGPAVLMPGAGSGSTRVMQVGGYDETAATPRSEVFDEANPSLGWKAASALKVPRAHHNTVLLPDGSMVSVGGGVGVRDGNQYSADPEHKQIELWDPASASWRLGPSQAESRAYHSTALLLPDARVISAGDDYNGGIDRDTAEIYEPPYLHKGPRPTITSAPASAKFGDPFTVATPNTNVTRATLVAPGTTTHNTDMNQRHISLPLEHVAGGVRLQAPPNATAATPGYYMLFLLNDQGVPSTAKFIKLDAAPPPPPPASSYADGILGTSGLAGYWRFGEVSGTVATAARGAVTGSYGVGVTLGRAGLIGGDSNTAAGVGGASGADVRFGDVFDFTGNERFSLEAWVKPTTVDATSRRVFSKEWSNAGGVQGYFLVNNSTRVFFSRMRDGAYESVSGPSLKAGTRYHVAVSYDGSTLSLDLALSAAPQHGRGAETSV